MTHLCAAITKAGVRCHNKTDTKYCWRHRTAGHKTPKKSKSPKRGKSAKRKSTKRSPKRR